MKMSLPQVTAVVISERLDCCGDRTRAIEAEWRSAEIKVHYLLLHMGLYYCVPDMRDIFRLSLVLCLEMFS